MADEIDAAAEIEELHRRASLSKLAPPPRMRSTGVCNWCGEKIETDRLSVLPYTPHCSECADELERDRIKAGKRGK